MHVPFSDTILEKIEGLFRVAVHAASLNFRGTERDREREGALSSCRWSFVRVASVLSLFL